METVSKASGSPFLEQMLIGGSLLGALAGETIPIENPATLEVVAEVPRARGGDVDAAVRSAGEAFANWRRVPARQRGVALSAIADDLASEIEALARTLAIETGNALRTQALPEVKGTVSMFRYFAAMATEMKGKTFPIQEGVLDYSRREPIGVVGAIIPWNAPLSSLAHKVVPALAAGNTSVLKPSEYAPLAVLQLGRICQRHLPPGVLNIITGYGPECGAALARHHGVRKLSFTGSTETGRSIIHAGADRIAGVSLELGGKSPQIVFPDVGDEDWAIDGVIAGMRFTRQGQSCSAGSRLFLHKDVEDQFLAKMTTKLEALKIGDPLDMSTDMGAIINSRQYDKVCSYIKEGLEQPGAELRLGGPPPTPGVPSSGYFVAPTVIAGVANDWRIAREEIFGPVICVIPWSEESEALRMANDTHYGLAAYIWSKNVGQALRAAHEVEAGWVQVNQGAGQLPGQSYGGYKQSGLGREFSIESMLEEFTENKHISVNLAH